MNSVSQVCDGNEIITEEFTCEVFSDECKQTDKSDVKDAMLMVVRMY